MNIRFLIPVDERVGSVRTVNYIIKMKEAFKPVINLLTVYDVSNIEGHGLVEEIQEKIEQTAKKVAEKTLDEFVKKFEDNGILVENSYVIKGIPGETICEESEKLNVDMIAISPNNESELANILMGSVTHYVIHHSNIPTLLVK